MSNVTNAQEAIKKLNMLTGGITYWLSETEASLITNLTGQVAKSGVINTAGPALTVEAKYSFAYKVAPGSTFGLTVKLGAEAPLVFLVSAAPKKETGFSLLSRLMSDIKARYGTEIEVTSVPGATIASSLVIITSNTEKDITISSPIAT